MALSHSPSIVTNGLALYFDAANIRSYPKSGTACNDLSGNLRNGSFSGSIGYSSTNNGSFVFNGSSKIDTSSASAFTLSSATFFAWIKITGGQSDYTGIIFSRTQTSSASGMNFYAGGIGYHWNNSYWSWNPGFTVPIGWSMVVLSIQSSFARTYCFTPSNILFSTNVAGHGAVSFKTIIGHDGNGPYFNGNLSIAQIYNRALSASEIAQNYNALRGRFGV